jgi:uncharacterized membrane protein
MVTRQERARQRLYESQRRVLYRWISRILTIGFWGSMAIIAAGLAVAGIQREPLGDEVAPVAEVLPAVFDLNPQGIVDLGILLLLFTPAVYTFVSLIIFARQRDRIFVVVCCALLIIVFFSVGFGVR